MGHHGFSDSEWKTAKAEAREVMIARARIQKTIAYSELVSKIAAIELPYDDIRLAYLLDEISTEEDALGHGLLSVVVVHKVGDLRPGIGFFKLAKLLGRDTSDEEKCWIEEITKVYAQWETVGA